MQEKKSEETKGLEELSRGDFLKMVSAAGLGIAGLGAFMSSPVSAQKRKRRQKKEVFVRN